jgi:divalent metal cation (Fe/Co/Zn/Cd) transporter
MKKNDVLSTLGAIVLVALFLGFLWLIGHYPLIAIGGCIGFLLWNLYRMLKELLKSILDNVDGEGK